MTFICPICDHENHTGPDMAVVKCELCLRSFQLEPGELE
jgi:transcription elongation factor Elf1